MGLRPEKTKPCTFPAKSRYGFRRRADGRTTYDRNTALALCASCGKKLHNSILVLDLLSTFIKPTANFSRRSHANVTYK